MENIAIYSDSSAPKKKRRKKIFLWIFFVLIFSMMVGSAYFAWKINAVSKKINIENSDDGSFLGSVTSVVSSAISSKHKPLQGENDSRINILLLGLGGGNHPGKNLTDTIMIMNIDTKNKKVALFSLPRDLYVKIPDTSYSTKINSIYQYGLDNDKGVESMKKTVEDVTGIPIHYYIILDFDGFKKIIDDIGGINIMVERDIYDPRYPGPNYSYETFEIKQGLHHLDGETALKYARERHNDPEGDFGRAKRQQQVIQATKNKVFSLQTFLNVVTLNNLLDTLGDNLKTNITLDEIESFITLAKSVDSQNITNVVADAWKKDSVLKGSHLLTSGGWASILVPRVGNWSDVQDLAQNIFDLDKIRARQVQIENEEASIAIVNQSDDRNLGSKISDLLRNKLNIKQIDIVYLQVKPGVNDTWVHDNTNGKKLFTLDELLKKLPARLGSGNSDIIETNKKYDFAISLGNDLKQAYSFDETNQEEWNKNTESQDSN
jgi:polyisoprenyl-teichoic acid--peptidoglycan teichoic acid transferase